MSAAFVAFTTHVEPAVVDVSVEPDTEQEPDTTAYDTAPVPEPPDVVNVNATPTVPNVEVTDKPAWFARVTEIVVSGDVAAL